MEITIRFLFPQYKSLDFRYKVTGGIPFELNSHGLRDYEYEEEKHNYRILCIGDSITFGSQNKLEDTFPKVLERLSGYEVINAGGVGGNTEYELQYIKEEGIKLNPDMVILEVCLNDIGDSVSRNRPNFWKVKEDFRIYNKTHDIRNNIRWFLRTKSRLWTFTEVNILRFLYKTGLKKYSFKMWSEENNLMAFGISDKSEKAWKIFEKYLLEMNEFMKSSQINFLVVVFPYQFQVGYNFFEIDMYKFTINPQERIKEICLKNKIHFIDILPYFKKDYYFPLDYCHPNKEGHRVTANIIYDYIR